MTVLVEPVVFIETKRKNGVRMQHISHSLLEPSLKKNIKQTVATCQKKQSHKFKSKMRFIIMFVVAVCFMFLKFSPKQKISSQSSGE